MTERARGSDIQNTETWAIYSPASDIRIVCLFTRFLGPPQWRGILFDSLKSNQDIFLLSTGPWRRYGQSKLANILYAAELSRRYGSPENGSITSVSIHLGTFNTNLVSSLGFMNRAMIYVVNLGNVKDETKQGEGEWNSCWAATALKQNISDRGFCLLESKENNFVKTRTISLLKCCGSGPTKS